MPVDSAPSFVDAIRQAQLLEPKQLYKEEPNMPAPTVAEFAAAMHAFPLLAPEQRAQVTALQQQFADLGALGQEMLQRGWLTSFQANQVAKGNAAELVVGPYVLLDRLGEGGMGVVYKARHAKMDRLVALKVIRKELLGKPDAVNRFEREVKAAARLTHPNIVTAFDAGQAGETHFFAMEYVEGTDLNKLVGENGPLPVAQACDCIRQAALGLQHAHEQGLVHRDIKPHNLMLTTRASPTASGPAVPLIKVMDLGLARLSAVSSTQLTHTGAVMGTPNYMPPEQILDAKLVDIRADVYALGCSLYHLLAGEPPFAGMVLGRVLVAQQTLQPKPLAQYRSDLPPDLIALVDRLMAKKPEDRFQVPGDVAQALVPLSHLLAAGAVVTVDASGPNTPAPTTGRFRRRWLAGAGLTALLIGVAVLSGPWVSHTSEAVSTDVSTDVTADVKQAEQLARLTWWGNVEQFHDFLKAAAAKRITAWQAAAARGDPGGQWLVGCCCGNGIVVPKDVREAAEWYRKAAEQDYPPAQCSLGFAYREALGVSLDDRDAARWFRKAAEQGDAAAQHILGWAYHEGRGMARDDKEALRWLRKAADQEHADAQFALGLMALHGWGMELDPAKGIQWYRKAAGHGHVVAQNNLGWTYQYGEGVPPDDAEAVRWYRKAAEQGYAISQHHLAFMYQEGRGVTRDDFEAVRWYLKAAEQGDVLAQNNLGWMYRKARNDVEACKWFRKAAEQGYTIAQNTLGTMYQDGRGVPPDYTEAVKWYRKAADRGNAGGQYNLGLMYLNGRGVDTDEAKAVHWFRKAADQGFAVAQVKLGKCYLEGTGVKADKTEASEWLRKAADLGNAQARELLGTLK